MANWISSALRRFLAIVAMMLLSQSLTPAPARACSPPPAGWNISVGDKPIPFEGAIVFSAYYHEGFGNKYTAEESLALGEIVVKTNADATVSGTVKYYKAIDRIVWKPAAPLAPAATYKLSVKLHDYTGNLADLGSYTLTTRKDPMTSLAWDRRGSIIDTAPPGATLADAVSDLQSPPSCAQIDPVTHS